MSAPLLSLKDLRVSFRSGKQGGVVQRTQAVGRDGMGISFDIPENTTVALVGESGSGKSVTAMSILNLLPDNAERQGAISFQGRELLTATRHELQALRGRDIACVFQEPMSSLNPAFTIGEQIVEGLRRHRQLGQAEAKALALQMLEKVRIPAPEQRFDEHPHKLSGGMRQRAMIAMALANNPRLLIADEPTTALDVTIQAQILQLMRSLQRDSGTAIVLITHDLGVVAEVADEVVVMYSGRIVERAPVAQLFAEPQHPYTVGLLGSMPRLHGQATRLAAIQGQVPNPLARASACRFAERCPFATAQCRSEVPVLRDVGTAGLPHWSACWHAPLDADVLLARRAADAATAAEAA